MTLPPPGARTNRLVQIAESNPRAFRRAFPAWLAKNRAIFDLFEFTAYTLRKLGQRPSAQQIADAIRSQARRTINNDFVPGMARLYNLLHPDHALFRTNRH